jgi:polyketide synthase PksJ
MPNYNTLTELIILRKNEEYKGVNFILGSDEEIHASYKDVYNTALRLLFSLQKSGYKPGDKVIFQIDDNQRFVYSFWACILGGMIPVPVTTGTNDEHNLKLFKIWDILNNPRMIASADFVAKLKTFADQNGLSEQMDLILPRVTYVEEVIQTENYGEIYYPERNDTAFIQFSSGSTGKPKGVIITHGNVLTNINSVLRWSHIDSNDASLSWMPLTHDMGLIGVHIKDMIACIDQYIIQTQLFIESPLLWIEKTSEHKITLLYSPNFGYKLFLKCYNPEDKRDWDLSSVRLIYNGAEPISGGLCNEFLDQMGVYGLKRSVMYPVYGLAEATIAVAFPFPGEEYIFHTLNRNHLRIGQTVVDTFKEDKNAITFMDVGYPIYDCYVRICEDDNNDLGENRIGYVQIRGGNVTSGYFNDIAATERLITTDGWLNTGDLGFLRNKRLTITGRAKDVIFVSGQNYYSQDIERVAEGVEGIELGKIVANGIFNKNLGSDDLVLFVLFEEEPVKFIPLAAALKKTINEKLGIEVTEIIPVTSIPKTSSGKIQRFRLSERYVNGDFDLLKQEIHKLMAEEFNNREITPPQNPTQEELVKIWSEVLNIERIGIHDDFFSLGGDSLKITQLLSRIRDVFDIELEQVQLFDNTDIESLSKIIETCRINNKFKSEKIESVPDKYNRAPLSFAQQRLWFLDKLNLQSPQYNLCAGLVLKGNLNKDALIRSLNSVIKRHHVLQMSFIEDNGQPVQIFNHDNEMSLDDIDLTSTPESERGKKALDIAKEEAAKPFHLEEAPLIRGKLLCTEKDEHILILVVHHIVFDGWSFGILLEELGFYYEAFLNGSAQDLPDLEIQYVDYALWQSEKAQKGHLENQIQYWKKQLGGDLPVLDLPTDKPRPSVQTYIGKKITSALSEELLEKLKSYAGKENATLFMVLFAAFNVLLYKYTGQSDIILGSPIANRNRKDIEGIIGFFTNNIVLRTAFSEEMDFNKLLESVKKVTLEAYSNQDVPFEKLVEELHVERNMSRNPLFQILFGMQNTPLPTKIFSEINVSNMDIDGGYSRFDLSLDVHETGDGIALDFEYNTNLFNDDTIIRMAGQYKQLLVEIIKKPRQRLDKIEILTKEDQIILNKLNSTNEKFEDVTNWTKLFEKQAVETPDAIAAVCGNDQISYRELDERSNRLAHYLISLGAGPERVLGIYMERSIWMLVGLLGIHKAGAAYLPMDPIFPQERLKYMLEDAKVKIILSLESLSKTLPLNEAQIICLDKEWNGIFKLSSESPQAETAADNLAYLIYTSGSTGNPKGVQIEQRALINFLQSMVKKTGINDKDTLLAVTTLSFDIAGLELYLPLICGAKTVIASREEVIDGSRLAEMLSEKGITIMQATPATWRLLIEAGWNGTEGLKALCGGEAFSRELANQLLERCLLVFNVYGPTETTIWSTLDKIETCTGPVMIGRPIANTQVYVLDKSMNRVPIGVAGELYIGGDGLARGYLNLPELTCEKFIPDPFSSKNGACLYKTGDLVKCSPDGKLEYVGRIDNQVKIRGYRIELGEIEALLNQQAEIKNCIVADKEIIPGEKSLVAYIIPAVSKDNMNLKAGHLRNCLKEKLPGYMIPSAFVIMDSYPLTPNGKIDRKALPVPQRIGSHDKTSGIPSAGRTEKIIASIWQDVLKTDDVDLNQNFFDAGGHSLLLAQVRSKIEKELHKEISMMDLFKYPTISSLARYLQEEEKTESENDSTNSDPSNCDSSNSHFPKKPEDWDKDNSIAVIGLSGRFPGAKNIDEFWENLCAGTESVSRFTDEQVLDEGVDPAILKKPGYVKAGGSLDEIDRFDALFFGYNPREAELLDPQQRIFLEEAWKALENAGYDSERFGGSIGLYGSMGMNTYAQHLKETYAAKGLAGDYQIMTSNDKDFLATRVAYKMGLEGPAVTVQTACSSSLVAVHLACQSLISRECDMALAGGVCIRIPQKSGYLYQEGMILSPDGCCRAFDQQANGTVGGNGAGVVVLKRLKDAVHDGDSISAVIKGSAINNDGARKIGYTAPGIDGQAKAVAMAQAKAGIDPESITYIEAHGTGTPLGDPIEIEALTKVFAAKTHKNGFCAIGSVKTNIGHLDAAAGVTGLIKTVLSLRNKKIPPSLHFENPNPKIDFKNSPFYVNNSLKEWNNASGPLRAGVSSFGIGGTNVHVILEEAPDPNRSPSNNEPCLLVFSAKDKKALNRMTSDFCSFLKENRNINIQDAAYTLQLGRREFQFRRYLVCTSVEDALEAFENTDGRIRDNIDAQLQTENRVAAENIEKLSLEEIGDRWLGRANIDWNKLYHNQKRKRVSLPVYPLEGQSYWFKKSDSLKNNHSESNSAKNTDISEWFYAPIWQQSVEDAGSITPVLDESKETVLVLKYKDDFSDALVKRMGERNLTVAVATAGKDYSLLDNNNFTLDIDNPAHYENLLKDITGTDKKALRIINLLGLTETEAVSIPEKSVEDAKKLFYSMLYLSQAIGKSSPDLPVQMKIVTNNAQRLFNEQVLYPEKALHLGACRVIPREYPNVKCGSIDIALQTQNGIDEPEMLDLLINETFMESKQGLVAYRGQERWEQDYKKIKLSESTNSAVKLKHKGVYLIAGGLGGIGLVIAGYLAHEVQARLVLVGRSEFPDEGKWDEWLKAHTKKDATSAKILKLRQYQACGAEVLISQTDVTNMAQMKNLHAKINAEFGTVDGIIHAAGSPGGGMIQLKKKENAEQVFAPKVQGTLVLHEVFKDCGLDFMLVCSSLNAITGGFGQIDYSGASAFLDAFAQAHNSSKGTKFISVDWDRWPGVGMASGTKISEDEVHPILGKCIADSSEKVVYMNQLSPEKDWVLSEHKIMSVPTIAGTTYLEMARAAIEDITGALKTEISEVIFLNPMVVKPGEYRKVFTILNKKENGYEFSIVSSAGEEGGKAYWQEHARGKIAVSDKINSKFYDIPKLKEKCSVKNVYLSDHQQTVSEKFISFGGRWRSLVSFSIGRGEGLAEVKLDKKYVSDMVDYKLHPAVLDVATGVIRLISGGNFLPFSYKSLRIYGQLPERLYSYVKLGKGYDATSNVITCDIDILSETGEILVEIIGFSMKKIEEGSVIGAKPDSTHGLHQTRFDYLNRALSGADKNNFLNEGITSAEGSLVFQRLIKGCFRPQIIVSTKNLDVAIQQANYVDQQNMAGNTDEAEDREEMHPRPELETEYVPPRNETEKKLSTLWQNILAIEKVGIYDEFFALGADSLLLIQFHSKLKESFATDIAIVDLYKYNTVALLAKHLQSGGEEDEKPNFEKVNTRANKQLEFLKQKKLLMQRKKGMI